MSRHRLEKFRTGCQEALEDADVKRDRKVLFSGHSKGSILVCNLAQSIGEVRLNLNFLGPDNSILRCYPLIQRGELSRLSAEL